jgi:hypothetical protein
MKNSQKKIFLSHATADKELADSLIELLTIGCDISPNDILCTSEPGMGIPIGNGNFIAYLQNQIQNPALVILLISQNYFASPFCLCELGATWGLKLPIFPLVVPPVKRANLKATLLVTQAGYVNSLECLHDLRDRIEEDLGKKVSTALWEAKAGNFVKTADSIIKSLPSPSRVPRAELMALSEKYEEAIHVIAGNEDDIHQLKVHIADLEKLKDREQAKAVRQKYSTKEEEFKRLRREASTSLEPLKLATRRTLFFEQRNEQYAPEDREEVTDAADAAAVQEVDHDESLVYSNNEHPRVRKAQIALNEFQKFLSNEKNRKFLEDLEDEYEFPMNIGNKDFWRKFLSKI